MTRSLPRWLGHSKCLLWSDAAAAAAAFLKGAAAGITRGLSSSPHLVRSRTFSAWMPTSFSFFGGWPAECWPLWQRHLPELNFSGNSYQPLRGPFSRRGTEKSEPASWWRQPGLFYLPFPPEVRYLTHGEAHLPFLCPLTSLKRAPRSFSLAAWQFTFSELWAMQTLLLQLPELCHGMNYFLEGKWCFKVKEPC